MEPTELILPDVLARVENGVFEVVQAEHEGSLRIPVAWLSVMVVRRAAGASIVRSPCPMVGTVVQG